jgi:hypothetical protein
LTPNEKIQKDLHEKTILKLIQKEVKDKLDVNKKEIFNQIKDFMSQKYELKDAKGNNQFKQILQSTGSVKLGAYQVELAKEFVMKAKMEADIAENSKGGVQEKLSFVRMEYFLYAFNESDRVRRELDKIGN